VSQFVTENPNIATFMFEELKYYSDKRYAFEIFSNVTFLYWTT
jgi:hypothetical protein